MSARPCLTRSVGSVVTNQNPDLLKDYKTQSSSQHPAWLQACCLGVPSWDKCTQKEDYFNLYYARGFRSLYFQQIGFPPVTLDIAPPGPGQPGEGIVLLTRGSGASLDNNTAHRQMCTAYLLSLNRVPPNDTICTGLSIRTGLSRYFDDCHCLQTRRTKETTSLRANGFLTPGRRRMPRERNGTTSATEREER